MSDVTILNATLVMPDRLLTGAWLSVQSGRIAALGTLESMPTQTGQTWDAAGRYLAPGFIDMHVHGGDGADFMDGDQAAFAKAIAAHRRHGTTGLVPTSTVAAHQQTLRFLELSEHFRAAGQVLGAHLYGPYFNEDKVGCHPLAPTRSPTKSEYSEYLRFANTMLVATCAPELPGASDFFRDAAAAGIRLNAGHSNASWSEMQVAFDLGMRHVDHFYCAMSSVPGLRERFGVPMQASMAEFVLATNEMTTEIIADGRHLAPDLLRFVVRMLGVDRVALVTDSNRALDMPPGEYVFGPQDAGVTIVSDGEVGWTADRSALASSVRGMDFMVRHMHQVVGLDLAQAVRMATLTPAKILGVDRSLGSLEVGKQADLVLLDQQLEVRGVWMNGVLL
ncbi:MAG: N-acetylglucosamine-6-phosphate deacetylase [Planctomycetales bacterium]|nr:N-acetylglucosamine-6-phosphate deacetylase [Planctomycetales bacterium]